MYLFVYKTTHKNGRYYIGRHQTKNLNDGYLGSGDWVKSIKDRSTLSREILVEANSLEELHQLEEYYINLHWDDPKCMNILKSSRGLTSEKSRNIQLEMVKNGNHNWQRRPDGSSNALVRVKNGTNPFLKRPDGSSIASDMAKMGKNPNQKRPDGTSRTSDKVKDGTNPFMTRPDGTNLQTDRLENGTHHFLQWKGLVPCYNKLGEHKRIPKEQFYAQSGPKENWEWVSCNSIEGRKRNPANL